MYEDSDSQHEETDTSIHYVEKEKLDSLAIPIGIFIFSLLIIPFYPFQAIGVIVVIAGFIFVRKKETTTLAARSLLTSSVAVIILGFILGATGIDIDRDIYNHIFDGSSNEEQDVCKGLIFSANPLDTCYDVFENRTYFGLESTKEVNEVNIQVVGEKNIFSYDKRVRIDSSETEKFYLGYNFSYYGTPAETTLVPIIYTDDGKKECFDAAITAQLDVCR